MWQSSRSTTWIYPFDVLDVDQTSTGAYLCGIALTVSCQSPSASPANRHLYSTGTTIGDRVGLMMPAHAVAGECEKSTPTNKIKLDTTR